MPQVPVLLALARNFHDREQCGWLVTKFSYLYVSGMVAIGCGIDEYMALNPAFKGNRGVAGVAAGGAAPLLPPPLPPATT